MEDLPSISIIIPCYNEGKRLPSCLKSIRLQEYSQEKLEILVVDDNSTDETVEIAKQFGCNVFPNGEHNIERGKSIGLANASNEFVLFLDADNILPSKTWLKDLVSVYLNNPNCFGGESIYFEYRKEHSIANRYCALFGINDPVVFYLKKQDKLMWTEKHWVYGGEIIRETPDYYILEFNPGSLPTLGSQGFLTKASLLKTVNWKPYLYHMDSQLELIEKYGNRGRYIFMKNGVIHLHSQTVGEIIRKLKRNIKLFHQHRNIRKYKYNISYVRLLFTILLMVTMIKPLSDSIKGFFKKPDIAWFLHPILCFYVPILYFFSTLRFTLAHHEK